MSPGAMWDRKYNLLYCIMNLIEWPYLRSAAARLSAFGASKFVVGSSSANIPQLRQNVSAKANRMIREART